MRQKLKTDHRLISTFDNINKTIGKLPAFYNDMATFMRNYYWRTLGNETKLQFLVATYIQTAYPGVTFMHPPNEAKRSKWEQYVAVYSGVKAGMPDIMIFDTTTDPSIRKYNGLALELKIGNNKQSPNQISCELLLKNCGWMTAVAYSFEDSKCIIDEYLKRTI